MALTATCDVYGRAKGVKPTLVLAVEIDNGGTVLELLAACELQEAKEALGKMGEVYLFHADLCPQASDRLKKKIVGGMTPPTGRKKKGDPT